MAYGIDIGSSLCMVVNLTGQGSGMKLQKAVVLPGVDIGYMPLLTFVAAVAIIGGLQFLFYRTALGRAFRWKRLMDDGTYASVSDIARAEKLDRTYVGDVLRLTLLAPEIVEVIVEGKQPAGVRLPNLLKAWPLEWVKQSWSNV